MSFDKDKIKELYPEAEDLMIQPMLIHSASDAQLRQACDSGDYFGQLKKDGALYQFVKTEHYSYLFGRTVSKKTNLLTEKIENVPYLEAALSALPANTILLGEIYYPGGSSRNTTEIMGCLPEKAIKRQNSERGPIHYYLYDILMYDNVDLIKGQATNDERYKILKAIFYKYNLDKFKFLELAESWYDNLYARVGQALAAGEEGMVIKKKDGLYQPNKRPLDNLKAKKVDFIDAIVIGFEKPTKEYYGKDITNWQYWIKDEEPLPVGCHIDDADAIAVTKFYYMGWNNSRLKIGAYNDKNEIVNIGTIHSGISDEMKKDMTQNPEQYLNQVCEIQAMEVDKNNKTIRHGFFLRLRPDKNMSDCTINTIFDK